MLQEQADAHALIGYSLSFCVSDILRGNVKEAEVTKIVASIKAPTRDDFESLLTTYAQTYWRDNPDEGEAIARRLYDAGKIDQPRLRGEEIMHVGNGHWKIIEPGKPAAAPQHDDSHLGLYDPEAVGAQAVETRREENTNATIAVIKGGTASPVVFRRLRFKTPR
jgi:hypothetical protein